MSNKTMLMFFFFFISLGIFNFFMSILFIKYKLFYFLKWEILLINFNSVEMIFYFDWMTFSFLSIVFFISSMVSLYSMEYMMFKKDQFIYLIFLFVFSMVMLITGMNMMSILIGWDGLGLVSYLLIIFFQSDKSKNSGMLTLILNRIGDIMIIFSSWIMFSMGGLNFIFYYNNFFIIMFIIFASMTKSAQIPFSSWLPAAMAAPTPVSSLVHSSTLVTAGIYLMIRFNNFFSSSCMLMKFILMFSTLTMLTSGLSANYETDLKKIIALSTLSQLGLMMMTLSMNLFLLSFFHLLTHALFKALLFLCSGIMLHNLKNNQDIRFMGMLILFLPYTVICFNVANLSLCGFMFLSGFFSKDLIIENFMMINNNSFIFLLLIVSTGLTVSYTFRLIYYLSFKNMNSFKMTKMKEGKTFSMVLLFMTFFSIIMGSSYNWIMFMIFFEPHMMLYMKMIIPFILMMGMSLSIFFSKKNSFFSSLIFLNYTLLSLKNVSICMAYETFIFSSFGFFEFFGAQSLYNYMIMISKINSKYILINFKLLTLLSVIILNFIYYL